MMPTIVISGGHADYIGYPCGIVSDGRKLTVIYDARTLENSIVSIIRERVYEWPWRVIVGPNGNEFPPTVGIF
jgi:hypothetical protein